MDYASEAFDAIESAVDVKIWRTNQRIQEIVRAENPRSINPYYSNPLWFTDILIRRMFTGGLTAVQGKILNQEGERFEESTTEPVLIDDLRGEGDDEYAAIFTERMFYTLLLTGMNFDRAKEEFFRVFDGRITHLEDGAREKGIFQGSLFYRRVDTPREKNHEKPLPRVPVMMS